LAPHYAATPRRLIHSFKGRRPAPAAPRLAPSAFSLDGLIRETVQNAYKVAAGGSDTMRSLS